MTEVPKGQQGLYSIKPFQKDYIQLNQPKGDTKSNLWVTVMCGCIVKVMVGCASYC